MSCSAEGKDHYSCSIAMLTELFFLQFIMLLKGKWQQISVLHVYHHASISFIW